MVFFPRERERNKKEKECEKTHRHFDASGRLPADFHVEEHDWVGHDDDDFLRVRFSKKKMRLFETTELSRFPFFLSIKKERKSAMGQFYNTQHKKIINATKAISLYLLYRILFKEPTSSRSTDNTPSTDNTTLDRDTMPMGLEE